MTNAQLNAKLISLVELSKTNGNAVEYLYEVKREVAGDWRMAQRTDNAIRFALKNAAILEA